MRLVLAAVAATLALASSVAPSFAESTPAGAQPASAPAVTLSAADIDPMPEAGHVKRCGGSWRAHKADLIAKHPGTTWHVYEHACVVALKGAGQ